MGKRQKTIKIKAFDLSVVFCLTNKVHKAQESLNKKYNIKEPLVSEDEVDGLTISANFNLYIIILDLQSVSYNLVGHEVCHAVYAITKDRDITDEETMAWLTGYLCEELHLFINKIKNEKPNVKNLPRSNYRPDTQGEDWIKEVRNDC
jgi:hypothetical protein